jgi:hypothetical protein
MNLELTTVTRSYTNGETISVEMPDEAIDADHLAEITMILNDSDFVVKVSCMPEFLGSSFLCSDEPITPKQIRAERKRLFTQFQADEMEDNGYNITACGEVGESYPQKPHLVKSVQSVLTSGIPWHVLYISFINQFTVPETYEYVIEQGTPMSGAALQQQLDKAWDSRSLRWSTGEEGIAFSFDGEGFYFAAPAKGEL